MTTLLPCTEAAIAHAAALLEQGQPVAFPTETVYGLGARADDAQAVQRVFSVKGRPEHKPLIVHVLGSAEARALASGWDDRMEQLARVFWPGPLTLIVGRGAGVVDLVAAGGDTLAVRAPAHEVARALLARCAFPVVAPSANRSGSAPPSTAAEVLEELGGRIELVLDGGATSSSGAPSTIVDVSRSDQPARILRHGAIPAAALRELLE